MGSKLLIDVLHPPHRQDDFGQHDNIYLGSNRYVHLPSASPEAKSVLKINLICNLI